ncbi:hypothetical protein EfmAA96_23570 [Enterococcus faecium]|nr:hypothetical protein EfmAA96_23570 [Enterococcus faecium]
MIPPIIYLSTIEKTSTTEEHDIIQLIKELEQQVSQSYPSSYHYVQRILELSKIKLDIEDTSMDRILLTIYLKKSEMVKEKRLPKAMIAAHGYATASSMANVVNRLLQEDLFESFDMPLDVTPQQIASRKIFIRLLWVLS